VKKKLPPSVVPFSLFWTDPETGDEFVSRHMYCGEMMQRGYSLKGWKLACIAVRKRESGFTYGGSMEGWQ